MTPTVAPPNDKFVSVEAVRLRVEDLRIVMKGGQTDVVDDVSFDVAAGEVLGLVGESGSGKTTVALALLAYARRGLEIAGGRVLVDGRNLLEMEPSDLQRLRGWRVAYVPQDPSSALNPALRVDSQIAEVLDAHPDAIPNVQKRLLQIFDEARLDHGRGQLRRYPHQLSGGQQQRVALAMAFACRPSLIVLDEPTTGLDVSTQRHILETVRSLCLQYGVAAVYVSHDLAVVSGLASRIAVMYAGRVVEMGACAEVFSNPRHPYTRGLISAVPEPDRAQALIGVPGTPPRPGRRPTGCFFAPRCSMRIDKCAETPPMIAADSGASARCWRWRDASPDTLQRASLPPWTDDPQALISIRGLTAYYGDNRALQEVSLEALRQRCTAIVGESGSGKTTLARCVVGLHERFSGDLYFDGQALARGCKRREKGDLRRIQYVFQNPYTSLNPRKTVGQLIAQPLKEFVECDRSTRRERVMRALTDVSLQGSMIDRYPDQLSGGERQRVAIARALVVDPDVLVCDEVTSALDVSVQAVIVELLRRLQAERQLTMIFITHNLALVRSIAQYAVVLASGSVVEAGTVGEVLERPQHPYTIGLINDIPKLLHGPTKSPRAPVTSEPRR